MDETVDCLCDGLLQAWSYDYVFARLRIIAPRWLFAICSMSKESAEVFELRENEIYGACSYVLQDY